MLSEVTHPQDRIFRRTLLELTRSDLSDLDTALKTLTLAASEALDVARVGVWFFEDSRQAIVCRCLYNGKERSHSHGGRLEAAEYPVYFASITEERSLGTEDARVDPRTREFTDGYLAEHRITSMLDVPIRSESRVVGMVCHEHVGPPRIWTDEEKSFAASVADLAALALETSRRKRAEEKLRALNQELEKRVAARTKALEAATAELEAFSHSVSHDLRAPLRVIEGFATVLRDEGRSGQGDQSGEQLDVIIRNAQNLSRLMDGYLAFSRVGRRAPHVAEVDVDAIARRVAAAWSSDRRGARVHIEIQSLPSTQGDAAMIRELLESLLQYATRDVSMARIDIVNVLIGCETEVSGTTTYFVCDDGVAPASDDLQDLQRLFDLFQRPAAEPVHEMSRVGLALARRVVDRHHGSIEASVGQDALGNRRGMTIRFTLPAPPD